MDNKEIEHTEEHQLWIRGLALEILTGEEKRQAQRNLLSCAACLKEYNAQREWIELVSDPAYVGPWETYLKAKNPRRYDLYRRAVSVPPPEEGADAPRSQLGYWFSVRAWRHIAFALASLLVVIVSTAVYQRITLQRALNNKAAYYQSRLVEQEKLYQSAVQDRRRVEEARQQAEALIQQNRQQAQTIEQLSHRLKRYLEPSLNATVTIQFFTPRASEKVPEITLPKEPLFLNFEIRVAEETEYPTYRMRLVDGSGKVVWQSDRARKDNLGNFGLLIEKSFLKPGGYTLKLYGIERGQPVLLAQIPFRIKG